MRKRIFSVTYKSQTRMKWFRLCTSFMSLQKIKFRPKLEKFNAFIVTKEDINVASVTKMDNKYNKYRVIFANKFFY